MILWSYDTNVGVKLSHSYWFKHNLEITSNITKKLDTYTHKNTHTCTYRANHWYPLCCNHRTRSVYAHNEAQPWLSNTHARSAKTPSTLSYIFLLLLAVSSLFMLRYASHILHYADGQSFHEFWPRLVALRWFIPYSPLFHLHTTDVEGKLFFSKKTRSFSALYQWVDLANMLGSYTVHASELLHGSI